MRLKEVAVLALASVYSWLMVIILVGLTLNLYQNFSLMGLLGFAIGIGLALPVKSIYRNMDSLYESLSSFYREKSAVILVTVLISVPSYFGFVYGYSFPLSGIINLSFHASAQVFLPVRSVYSGLLGSTAGGFLFDFGRFYIHLLWVYMVSGLSISGIRWFSNLLDIYPESELRADVLPFSQEVGNPEIEVYIVTGVQGLLKIPESFCKECHMFVKAAQEAADEIDSEVDIEVKSYWTRFLRPLLKGGTHPPVILVNGDLIAQGYDVPESEDIVEKLS